MANLLPKQHKRTLRREYRFRILALALLMGSFLLASIAVFAAAGAAALFSTEKDVETYARSLFASEESGDKAVVGRMESVNEATTLLGKGLDSPSVHEDIIGVVIALRGELALTDFRFVRAGDGGGGALTISGIAPRRTDLTSFIARLEKKPYFKEVHTPLASLVKERDISFSINAEITFE